MSEGEHLQYVQIYSIMMPGRVVIAFGEKYVDIARFVHSAGIEIVPWLTTQCIPHTLENHEEYTRILFESNSDRDSFLLDWSGVKHNGYAFNQGSENSKGIFSNA